MNVKLVVVEGAKQATIRLRLPTIMGRSPDAAVKVPSSLVSRKHCEIYRSGNELAVRDLGSANGTFVNGERVEGPSLLFEEDLLRVGPITVRVFQDESKVAARPQKAEPAPRVHQAPAEDDPDSSAGASSILNYRETDDGSFLGIEDFDDEEDEPGGGEAEPLAEDIAGQSAVQELGKVVEQRPRKVEGGDSALGSFFKNLE